MAAHAQFHQAGQSGLKYVRRDDTNNVEAYLILERDREIAIPTAATDTATLTVAQMAPGVELVGIPTAAAAYTTPTAVALIAAHLSEKNNIAYTFHIDNQSAGANTITLTAGAGVTIRGTATVAQNITATFRVRRTTATAVVISRY